MNWKKFFKPTKFKLIFWIILISIIMPYLIFLIMYALAWGAFVGDPITLITLITIIIILILISFVIYIISCAIYPLWKKIISFCNTNRRKMVLMFIIIIIFFLYLKILPLVNPLLFQSIYGIQKNNNFSISYSEFQYKFKLCLEDDDYNIDGVNCYTKLMEKTKDVRVCDDMNFSEIKDTCYSILADNLNKTEVCKKIKDKDKKNLCLDGIKGRRNLLLFNLIIFSFIASFILIVLKWNRIRS